VAGRRRRLRRPACLGLSERLTTAPHYQARSTAIGATRAVELGAAESPDAPRRASRVDTYGVGTEQEPGHTCSGFIRTSSGARVPGERVDVGLRAGSVVLPALAAIARAHQAAQLDPDQEQVGVVRARRDPAYVRRPRPRREPPVRPRGQLESAFNSRQLSPLSPLRNSRLGSVPPYTAPSAALTASENTARSVSSQSIQLRPPSKLRRTPPSRRPTKTVSGSAGSTARHCAPLPGKER
jgi:hypothetical protein